MEPNLHRKRLNHKFIKPRMQQDANKANVSSSSLRRERIAMVQELFPKYRFKPKLLVLPLGTSVAWQSRKHWTILTLQTHQLNNNP